MNELEFPKFLLLEGAINQDELQKALQICQEEECKFGQALIKNKILDKSEVIQKLQQYIQEI